MRLYSEAQMKDCWEACVNFTGACLSEFEHTKVSIPIRDQYLSTVKPVEVMKWQQTRKFSDATDVELKEMFAIVFKRSFPDGGNIYFHAEDKKTPERKCLWSGLDRFIFAINGDHWADCDLSYYSYNQHAITIYLISKGFFSPTLATDKK